MKRDSGPSLADRMDEKLDLWSAEIEIALVRFSKTNNTQIEFRNEIDIWSKMEFKFRAQIKEMKAYGRKPTRKARKEFKDLETLVYSIRDKLD